MADRTKRFTRGVVTAYASIAVNILYSLASVPLALKYLGKAEFGLWALALQITGYLMLLDLGISSALNRMVANHKEEVDAGEYGGFLTTGLIVMVMQGTLIALGGVIFSIVAPSLFSIPPKLQVDFRNVLVITSILSGLSLVTRAISAPLWAFQRIEVGNITATITLIMTFPCLWLGFSLGWGIYSLPLAGIPALIMRTTCESFVCWRNGYYPSRGNWGRPSWNIFHQVFGFGKDVFLMGVGSQMVNATQIMIISRCLGLDAAATFSVGTKFYAMGQQLVSKLMESSSPGLTEVFIHGDFDLLRRRFWNIISITSFLAVLAACMIVLANSAVIDVWTSGLIHWTLTADLLLGGLLVVTSVTRCFVALFGITGNYGPIRHIYLIEGALFLVLSIPAAKVFGINGVLFISLVAHLLTTGLLSILASRGHVRSCRQIIRYAIVSLLVLLSAYGVAHLVQKTEATAWQIILFSPVPCLLFAIVGWVTIMEESFKMEIRKKIFALFKLGEPS